MAQANSFRDRFPTRKWFDVAWDNADNKLNALPEDRKENLNKSTNRLNEDLYKLRYYRNQGVNVIPEYYNDHAKKVMEMMDDSVLNGRSNAEVSTMIMEEAYVLDREKARVYYENNIFSQIFASVTQPLGRFRWDLKQYGIQKIRDAVKWTKDFADPNYIQLKVSNQFDTGIGMYVGYQISKTQLMQNDGNLFDLQHELVLQASEQIGRAMNERIATGTTTTITIPNDDGASAPTYTGFLNHANTQDFAIGTTSTWGNWIKGIKAGLADLKTVRGTRNIVMLMTAGCHSQMEANYPSYGRGDYTEWDEVQRRFIGPNKPIKRAYISDKILGSTPSASTQGMILIDIEQRYMDRKLVLPLQTWPSLEKTWAEDIKEVMVVGDIIRHKLRPNTSVNAFPVTKEDSLTTADTGYLEEMQIA